MQIDPTVTSIDQLNVQYGFINVPWLRYPWTDLTVFPTPYTEISLHRSGETHGMFPNTEFLLSDHNNKLTIVIGESWTYGGKIRDMNIEGGESRESFTCGITETVGPWLGYLLETDLYQNAFPGDDNSNMVRKACNAINRFKDHYDEIFVFVQFTDVIRESGLHRGLPENDHVLNWMNQKIDNPELRLPVVEWLNFYENGYLDTLNIASKHANVKTCVWKNFAPWSLTPDQQARFQNLTFVQNCWINYISELEGFPVNIRYFNNAASLSQAPGDFGDNFIMDDEFVVDELSRIERLHKYWDDISSRRGSMGIHYPSRIGHQLWSLKIINDTGWYTEK